MYHFFINSDQVETDRIRITGSDVNHIKNVLRMRVGEEVTVSVRSDAPLSGSAAGKSDRPSVSAMVYHCTIGGFPGDEAELTILSAEEGRNELPCRITLFQGVPKSDKLELIIQKAVELGVHEIVPVSMKRCVAKIEPKKEEAKLKRYNGISESAAKQSGRNMIPEVKGVMTLKQAMQYAGTMNHVIVPYELAENMEETRRIIDGIQPGESIAIFIGPEGGFERSEVEALMEQGARPITLGPRILRTEPAPRMILSILGYKLS